MACSLLRNLTGTARDDVLMTLPATLRVVSKTQAVRDSFNFFEDESVVVEGAKRNDEWLKYCVRLLHTCTLLELDDKQTRDRFVFGFMVIVNGWCAVSNR
jgi:hypothetical protein